jgi:hypothetical protein
MQILDMKHIEDCFDGSFIKEILFDKPVTYGFIKEIGNNGKLSYFKDFARPFYKIIFRGDFYIKGVEGNNTARLVLRDNKDIDYIYNLIKKGGEV